MRWRLNRTPQFKKGFKKAEPQLRERILHALEILGDAEDPREHGRRKHGGRFKGYYGWDFGRTCRLLYLPVKKTEVILLDRVCDHGIYDP